MTISELGTSCMNTLDELVDKSSSSNEDSRYALVDDFRGRFRIWAANIGALQPVSSPKSLDYRVREADDMKSSIMSGLGRIKESGTTALRILSGDAINRHKVVNRDGRPEIEKDELQELLLNIKSAIDHLFELSVILRRHRPRGRTRKATFEPITDSQDITNVADKFPKAKENPWLLQRLGNAVSQRRKSIQYRQKHRPDLFEDKGKDLKDTMSSKATTFSEVSGEIVSLAPVRASSLHGSATSFASDQDTVGEAQGLRVPNLTDMIIDGVPLGYEERFECPYCRTICSVRDRYEWKQHVFSDLQPYICTFQDCEQPLRLFETRGAWFKHELQAHRQRWSCLFCKLPNYLQSPDDLQRHFEEIHSGSVTSHQLPWVLKACERLEEDDIISCCLCEEWTPTPTSPNNLESFSIHLARHLQQISLASIPLHIKGLEMRHITEQSSFRIRDNTGKFANTVAPSPPSDQAQEEARGCSTQQSGHSEETTRTLTSVMTGQRADPAEVVESAPRRSAGRSFPTASAANRGRGGSKKPVTYVWVWYCSNCSTGPLNASTDQACQTCRHWRCEYCAMQQIALPANR